MCVKKQRNQIKQSIDLQPVTSQKRVIELRLEGGEGLNQKQPAVFHLVVSSLEVYQIVDACDSVTNK